MLEQQKSVTTVTTGTATGNVKATSEVMYGQQLWALFARSFRIRLRNWEYLLIDFGISFFFLAVYSHVFIESYYTHYEVSYDYVEEFLSKSVNPKDKLYFSPASSTVKSFMLNGRDDEFPETVSFDKLENLDQRYVVVFENMTTAVPKHLSFKVVTKYYYNTYKTFDTFVDCLGPDVLYVQYAVTRLFINYWLAHGNATSRLPLAPSTIDTRFVVLPLPRHPHTVKLIWRHYILSWIITLMYMGTACLTTQFIVEDKEHKLKETMAVMGLRSVNYWVGWSVSTLIFGLVPCFMYSLVFFWDNKQVFDFRILMLLLLAYLFNTISFSCMISCFISRARHAVIICCTMTVLMRILVPLFDYIIINRVFAHLAGFLFYQSGIELFYILVAFQIEEYVFDTRHWWPFYKIFDQLDLLDVLFMLISNTLFNFCMVWFVESGRGGDMYAILRYLLKTVVTAMPVPAIRSWAENSLDIKPPSETFVAEGFEFPEQTSHHFEGASDMTAEIQIRKLIKVFDGVVTMSISDLDIYKERITVMLGQSGAGKTNLVNMITGVVTPTAGDVFISGHSINLNPDGARLNMGFSRQNDVTFDLLTCEEHLAFYAKLKSRFTKHASKAIPSMLEELGLADQSSLLASTLSPGQKRMLSVACAFVGETKIIVLDEPFFGLDPCSRSDLCSFLRTKKHSRTIVLTTQDLQDADDIGDRIMILSKGVVQCYGSPNFLRKPYGYSYKLTVRKEVGCDIKETVKVIKTTIPHARYMRQTDADFTFILPETKKFLFPRLLDELEKNENNLKISKVKLVAASISEVMNCIMSDSSADILPNTNCGQILEPWIKSLTQYTLNTETLENFLYITEFPYVNKLQLFLSQTMAILRLKNTFLKRNFGAALGFLLLPITLVLFGIVLDLRSAPDESVAPVEFTPERLYNNLVFPIFYEISSVGLIKQEFQKLVQGMGTFEQYEYTSQLDDNIWSYAESTLTDWSEKKSIESYLRKVQYSLVSGESGQSSILLYYRKTALHADALGMQLLMNAWVKQALGDEFSIQSGAQLHPSLHVYPLTEYHSFTTGVTFFLAMALAIVPIPFMYNIIDEKNKGIKHLQYTSGLSPLVYWLGHFLYDAILYLILVVPILIATLFSKVANIHSLVILKAVPAYSLFLFPHMYVLQFCFQSPAIGAFFFLISNVFFGVIIGMVLDYYLRIVDPDNYQLISLFAEASTPFYSLCLLLGLVLDGYTVKVDMEKYLSEYWAANIKRACITWSTIAFLEFRVFRVFRYFMFMFCEQVFNIFKDPISEDEDVMSERSKIESTSFTTLFKKNALVLRKLRKSYYSNMKLVTALHTTSLGVQVNGCLALMGPAGSGKSTVFKMLTGRISITSGDVYLFGQSLKTELVTMQSIISYCPQQDALHDYLSAREIFQLHAIFRGIQSRNIDHFVQLLLELLSLTPHADSMTCSYSYGQKRCVSLGIAVIGAPKMIYLDEPTLGIGQEARLKALALLQNLKFKRSTIVVTTHSKDDLDALSTRAAILVKGRVVRLSNPEFLLDRYGQGHFVTLFSKTEESKDYVMVDSSVKYILKSFKNSKVFFKHRTKVVLQIPEIVPVSVLYETLDKLQSRQYIRQYSVNEITLDKILVMLMMKEP